MLQMILSLTICAILVMPILLILMLYWQALLVLLILELKQVFMLMKVVLVHLLLIHTFHWDLLQLIILLNVNLAGVEVVIQIVLFVEGELEFSVVTNVMLDTLLMPLMDAQVRTVFSLSYDFSLLNCTWSNHY